MSVEVTSLLLSAAVNNLSEYLFQDTGFCYPPGVRCGAQARQRPAGTVGGEEWLR